MKARSETYQNRPSIRLEDTAPPDFGDEGRLALLRGSSFQDGVIEVDVAGDTPPGADPIYRGFVGIAFRVAQTKPQFECLYIRPKNGRSQDQLQRNHSTQYISVPGFPWQKLRAETPGKYESYADLVTGQWTHLKIVVAGTKAELYIGNSQQPALIVNDLKQPTAAGAIALWIGPGTVAHFANLITSPPQP